MMTEQLTSLREDHKAQTRARILDACAALILAKGVTAVSIASVAERAGVSERTVYRHFGDRENMIRSIWGRVHDSIGKATASPSNVEQLIEAPVTRFPQFDQHRKIMRAYLDSQRRRELSVRVKKTVQRTMVECVRLDLADLHEDELRRRAAIAELLISPDAWDRISRVWDFSGEEAGVAAAEALEILFDRYPPEEDILTIRDEPLKVK